MEGLSGFCFKDTMKLLEDIERTSLRCALARNLAKARGKYENVSEYCKGKTKTNETMTNPEQFVSSLRKLVPSAEIKLGKEPIPSIGEGTKFVTTIKYKF